jgi:hypothetical protein
VHACVYTCVCVCAGVCACAGAGASVVSMLVLVNVPASLHMWRGVHVGVAQVCVVCVD